MRYMYPTYYYDKNGNTVNSKDRKPSYEEAQTGWSWFYDNVKSFIYMSMPQFGTPFPIIAFLTNTAGILSA